VLATQYHGGEAQPHGQYDIDGRKIDALLLDCACAAMLGRVPLYSAADGVTHGPLQRPARQDVFKSAPQVIACACRDMRVSANDH